MYFILVKISNYRALNTQKHQNGGILGGCDVIGSPRGLGSGKILKGSNLVKNLILEVYFILVKISNYRAQNTQKRQNGGILGGYDVIGGSWDLIPKKKLKRSDLAKIFIRK